jgi:hypothetical protein
MDVAVFLLEIYYLQLPNGWRLTPLRNSSPPKKRVVIAPGGGGAWPLPLSNYHFSRKKETLINRFLAEPCRPFTY